MHERAHSPERLTESFDFTKTLNSGKTAKTTPRASLAKPVFTVEEITSNNKVLVRAREQAVQMVSRG